MEARAPYGPWQQERPRLTVVHDDGASTYSALPHAVLFDTRLSHGARLLYAVMQAHWWQGGECWASHATLADQLGCSGRMLRYYIRELVGAGYITERRRGHGQAKAYSPSQQAMGCQLKGQEIAACDSNRQPVATQQATDCQFNRQPVADRSKRTEEDSPKEEDKDIPADSPERIVFDYYRSKIQPAARVNAPEKIRTRLKHFSVAELKAGIDHFAADAWWMENNAARGAAWFFDSDKRSEQFLNLTPRPKPQTNGSGPIPPKQSVLEGWAGFKGRYGGNIIKASHDDGR